MSMLILISGLYALLMVTDHVPAIGLGLLALLWLLHWIFTGRLTYASPMDLPILVMLGLLPLSLVISIDPSLSLPKIYGLVLSIALFFVIINLLRNYQRLKLAILALIILGLGTALLGLLVSPRMISRLPQLATLFPLGATENGVNPNTVGGALTFFVPLLTGLLFDGGAYKRVYLEDQPRLRLLAQKLLVLFTLVIVAIVLILTRSRGAYLGSAVGLAAFAIWKDRRFLWLIPLLLVVFAAAFFIFAEGDLWTIIQVVDTADDAVTLPSRLTTWRGSIHLIQDFPFTGTGIGTYSRLYTNLYTINPFPDQMATSFHPHNTFLAVAVDLGIPALVLYTALLTSFALTIQRSFKYGRSITQVLLMGVACGVLAHQVFGIMDSFLLGTKLGVIQWIFFGIAAAIYIHKSGFHWRKSAASLPNQHADNPTGGQPFALHLTNLLIGLVTWAACSLAAITFLSFSPLFSLAIAVIGGVLLGVTLTHRHRKLRR